MTFSGLNLHDVHEMDHAVMNDVDEKLNRQQRECELWAVDDIELEITGSDHGSDSSAFNIGFADPEERALMDLLEMEGRSSVDAILQRDFLGFPSCRNPPRLSQLCTSKSQPTNRLSGEFLRAFFDDESITGSLDESRNVFNDADSNKQVVVVRDENSALDNLKKAVAGWLVDWIFVNRLRSQ